MAVTGLAPTTNYLGQSGLMVEFSFKVVVGLSPFAEKKVTAKTKADVTILEHVKTDVKTKKLQPNMLTK